MAAMSVVIYLLPLMPGAHPSTTWIMGLKSQKRKNCMWSNPKIHCTEHNRTPVVRCWTSAAPLWLVGDDARISAVCIFNNLLFFYCKKSAYRKYLVLKWMLSPRVVCQGHQRGEGMPLLITPLTLPVLLGSPGHGESCNVHHWPPSPYTPFLQKPALHFNHVMKGIGPWLIIWRIGSLFQWMVESCYPEPTEALWTMPIHWVTQSAGPDSLVCVLSIPVSWSASLGITA